MRIQILWSTDRSPSTGAWLAIRRPRNRGDEEPIRVDRRGVRPAVRCRGLIDLAPMFTALPTLCITSSVAWAASSVTQKQLTYRTAIHALGPEQHVGAAQDERQMRKLLRTNEPRRAGTGNEPCPRAPIRDNSVNPSLAMPRTLRLLPQ